jgi:diguanylate cyclase (GGDEF)-like protein
MGRLHLKLDAQNKARLRSRVLAIAPFAMILGILAGLSLLELKFQDGGRVFLIDENLWAGAEKDASFCLLSYSTTGSDKDLQCFRAKADVLLGEMQARRELDTERQAYSVIAGGFLRARNRQRSIRTAIILYDIASRNRECERAIKIWRETDPNILQLVSIADRLQRTKDPGEMRRLQQEVIGIDSSLSRQERDFVEHINNGMHFLAICLCAAQCVAALMLILLAVMVYRRMIVGKEVAQEQVHFLAHYDPLTGLANRTLLHLHLSAALAQARTARKKVAVLLLDLDHFKIINDSLGHSAGDALLKEMAERIKKNVRDCDTVARVGGDGFLVILAELDNDSDANQAAERIMKAISAGYTHQGVLLNATCSIGISLFPDFGEDCETLIKNADAAMYCAKESGRNRVRFFAEEMNAGAMERLTMENNLRMALDRQEFFLEYQPQMEIATGRVTGLEALLRWKHPVLGLISPGTFIKVAEVGGLILPIGEWVLRTACAQVRRWQDEGLPAIPVAVNVSAVQFRQEGFCDLIRTVLHETGLAPQFLELELTESLLLSNEDVMFRVLNDLKAMGVNLTIDDFGTGYSSLSYLRQFPVTKLKIDRSFINDVARNSSDAAIATAIISMGRHLNLRVIAEGVENEEQLAFLRAQRCDQIQGYYLSKPLSAAELPHRLHRLQLPMVEYEMAATSLVQ